METNKMSGYLDPRIFLIVAAPSLIIFYVCVRIWEKKHAVEKEQKK
jgi:hypothetical protein